MVRERFQDVTVFTIAHRLHTVIDNDTIVVLDKGSLAEMGPPQKLVTEGGIFAGMWTQHQVSRGSRPNDDA
jgi:ABC-type multidrug transport system fused ATPase/permease subunit